MSSEILNGLRHDQMTNLFRILQDDRETKVKAFYAAALELTRSVVSHLNEICEIAFTIEEETERDGIGQLKSAFDMTKVPSQLSAAFPLEEKLGGFSFDKPIDLRVIVSARRTTSSGNLLDDGFESVKISLNNVQANVCLLGYTAAPVRPGQNLLDQWARLPTDRLLTELKREIQASPDSHIVLPLKENALIPG